MRLSERICRMTAAMFAVIMSIFGTAATCGRITRIVSNGEGSAAAHLSMTNLTAASDIDVIASSKPSSDTDVDTDTNFDSDTGTDSETVSDINRTGEKTYLVTETMYRESNMTCGNFYVKNATDISLDLNGYLAADLPFEKEDTSLPQVLIVHTHATESYMDSDLGYYYESYDPSNDDDERNVVRVGDEICASLKEHGITALHCRKHHNEPSYLGAYDCCAESINEYLAQYPSLKIVLDIHRDSIMTDDGERIKPTFEYGGEKAAQIMIMCGNDNNGYYDFPNWQQNMSLAVKLQSIAETNYPGMTRPLSFGNFMYNMNLAPGSLLIEIGTDANTLDEAVLSGKLLGSVVAQVLEK